MPQRRGPVVKNDDEGEEGDFPDKFSFVPAENASVRMWYRGKMLWISGVAGGVDSGTVPAKRLAKSFRKGRAARLEPRATGVASAYRLTFFGRDKVPPAICACG